MKPPFIILVAALLMAVLSSPTRADDLTVTVQNEQGKALGRSVVVLVSRDGEPLPVNVPEKSVEVRQFGQLFDPAISVVAVGSKVTFTNEDSFRHHIYSFSRSKKFSLESFYYNEQRSISIDTAGVIGIGCNIHDNMQGFLYAVDSGHAKQADGNGVARFKGIEPGVYTLDIWYPGKRQPDNAIITVEGEAQYDATLSVRVFQQTKPEADVLDIDIPD